jgi:hypothetical protein
MIYLDEQGTADGYEDVVDEDRHVPAHYASCGLGAPMSSSSSV